MVAKSHNKPVIASDDVEAVMVHGRDAIVVLNDKIAYLRSDVEGLKVENAALRQEVLRHEGVLLAMQVNTAAPQAPAKDSDPGRAKGIDPDHAKDIALLRSDVEGLKVENAALRDEVTQQNGDTHKLAASGADPDRAKKVEAILCQHGLHQWARGRVEAQHVRAVLLALAEVL